MITARQANQKARNYNTFKDIFESIKDYSEQGNFEFEYIIDLVMKEEFESCFKQLGYRIEIGMSPNDYESNKIRYKINWK